MDKDIKRIRLLKLWEILSRDTDDEHPLGTEEILSKLANAGIECVRTTLYEDIFVAKSRIHDNEQVFDAHVRKVKRRNVLARKVFYLYERIDAVSQCSGFIQIDGYSVLHSYSPLWKLNSPVPVSSRLMLTTSSTGSSIDKLLMYAVP